MSEKVGIIGSSDLAQCVFHFLESDERYLPIGYFDDFKICGDLVNGVPVLGGIKDCSTLLENKKVDSFIVAIGYKHIEFRERLVHEIEAKLPLMSYIHPNAFVDVTVDVGVSSIIFPGCTIDQRVEIGKNTVLNSGCVISHDTNIGAFSFFGPGVVLSGFVNIGQRAFIGSGTTVIDNVRICDDVQTGGGSVVVRNIGESGLYVGVPATFKRALVKKK